MLLLSCGILNGVHGMGLSEKRVEGQQEVTVYIDVELQMWYT